MQGISINMRWGCACACNHVIWWITSWVWSCDASSDDNLQLYQFNFPWFSCHHAVTCHLCTVLSGQINCLFKIGKSWAELGESIFCSVMSSYYRNLSAVIRYLLKWFQRISSLPSCYSCYSAENPFKNIWNHKCYSCACHVPRAITTQRAQSSTKSAKYLRAAQLFRRVRVWRRHVSRVTCDIVNTDLSSCGNPQLEH